MGLEKLVRAIQLPVERARVQELRIVLDSCFLHINTENFIPSCILHL